MIFWNETICSLAISISEEPAASIFKTEVFSTFKMEAAGSSETLLPTYNRHQIPEKCSLIILNKPYIESWDNKVGIVTDYRLGDQGVGVRVPVGARIFTSPCRPDQPWGPPSLLSNGYQQLFPHG
jgi:hypothetical protein